MDEGAGEQSPWGIFRLESGEERSLEIGPLKLRIRRLDDELWISSKRSGMDPVRGGRQQSEWSRWALSDAGVLFSIQPTFPDRSVVVTPGHPFRLGNSASARIYVRVPVWVRLSVAGSEKQPLVEIPTVELSKTWFGDFDSGERCYWVATSARRKAIIEQARPHLAICRLRIKNEAEESLLVEKICHRVGSLALYEHEGQLWANDTMIAYQGGLEVSRIEHSHGPPSERPDARRITEPRAPIKWTLRARTFRTLQALGGIGMRPARGLA